MYIYSLSSAQNMLFMKKTITIINELRVIKKIKKI